MITATIIKREYPDYNRPPYTMNNVVETEQEISAETKDELFGLFFREYDNRYKYCNSISFGFKDENHQSEYREWFSDVRNYANNGGDMW